MGGNVGNGDHQLVSEAIPWMGREHSLGLTLRPLGGSVPKLA
jgi:hypothetical protein